MRSSASKFNFYQVQPTLYPTNFRAKLELGPASYWKRKPDATETRCNCNYGFYSDNE